LKSSSKNCCPDSVRCTLTQSHKFFEPLRTPSSSKTFNENIEGLLEEGVSKGSKNLCDCVRVHLTESGQQFLLEDFNNGFGYTVEPMLDENTVNSCFEGIKSRYSSGERFGSILLSAFQCNAETVCIYMYITIYIYMCIYVYIHTSCDLDREGIFVRVDFQNTPIYVYV
jgi:hypothetical protein